MGRFLNNACVGRRRKGSRSYRGEDSRSSPPPTKVCWSWRRRVEERRGVVATRLRMAVRSGGGEGGVGAQPALGSWA